jgi:hypothetical protein
MRDLGSKIPQSGQVTTDSSASRYATVGYDDNEAGGR